MLTTLRLQRLYSVLFLLLFGLGLVLPQQAQARGAPETFADLADKLLPSVVNISTTQTLRAGAQFEEFEFNFPEGSPFEKFFEEFKNQRGKMRPNGQEPKQKATSLGSGFIIDPSGYIVTNYHVIQDAEEITVILHDDTNLTATVIGKDKKTDIAILKVDSKKPLTAVSLGDSDKARVGDWVLAIGNPFGLGGSVTSGIISARARDINAGPYDDFIQTDAPMNRGNSGGPLFNMDGEVVGINTAIYSPSGGSVGIGFAIPSSMAKNVIEQLKNGGQIRRGWLGVRIQIVTPEIAASLGLPNAQGALVSSVTAEGPAAVAKVQAGDVILTFDGKDVTDMHRLPRIVAETEINKTVDMVVFRKGQKVTLKVKVGEMKPEEDEEEITENEGDQPPAQPQGDKVEELDMKVSSITDAIRKKYSLPKETSGVVIMSVSPDGLAAEYGLRPGDVISEVAQQEIKTAKDLSAFAQKAKKEERPMLLLIDRKGDLRFIAINLDKKKKK